MQFRTEIEPLRGRTPIDHDTPVVMLGSCFTDEIGKRLSRDGFNVTANPMGTLYNPASIATVIERALAGRLYGAGDLTVHDGLYHCLDFPSVYRSDNPDELLSQVNAGLTDLGQRLEHAGVWIITLGTARVYSLDNTRIIGNCHKLPSSRFTTFMLDIDDIVARWQPLVEGRRVIFTVSPIRHLADGLHGNQLSKATLLLALNKLTGCEYFPAYEILLDDLRDYRFYASDMKHPSEVAVDYVYQRFAETYFTKTTLTRAAEARKKALFAAHRPILTK